MMHHGGVRTQPVRDPNHNGHMGGSVSSGNDGLWAGIDMGGKPMPVDFGMRPAAVGDASVATGASAAAGASAAVVVDTSAMDLSMLPPNRMTDFTTYENPHTHTHATHPTRTDSFDLI